MRQRQGNHTLYVGAPDLGYFSALTPTTIKTTPYLDPPVAFNISHDNGLVAMVFGPGTANPPSFTIGIDVMKVRIPGRESFRSFVETVGDQASAIHRCVFLN